MNSMRMPKTIRNNMRTPNFRRNANNFGRNENNIVRQKESVKEHVENVSETFFKVKIRKEKNLDRKEDK